jgi:integrase/recombinase XerD
MRELPPPESDGKRRRSDSATTNGHAASAPTRALARIATGERSDARPKRRSVRSKRWAPPEGLMPDQARAVIAAAPSDRDRLLLRVLWGTGARISEALTLRAIDVGRDSLDLPNRKDPDRARKRVFLPAGELDLPGALLVWASEHNLGRTAPLFFSRKRAHDGGLRPTSRQQAWEIVKAASRRAGVGVQAMRTSKDGPQGDLAPIHPHLFRHSRVRQNLRTTKGLPIVQKQAGWATLQATYLRPDDEEVRRAMLAVQE